MTRSFIVAFTLFMLNSTYVEGQGVFVDGFDYPLGNRGYLAGAEYEIPEDIVPEQNNYYPTNAISNPQRGSGGLGTWYNISDVGDWAISINKDGIITSGGIHPGEDWNHASGYSDAGDTVYATANGIIINIKPTRGEGYSPTISGWTIIIEHTLPDGHIYYSIYNHITSFLKSDGSPNITGAINLLESEFTTADGLPLLEGISVSRGEKIARIGHLTSFSSHLHFEIRDHNLSAWDPTGLLYPNGVSGRYPDNDNLYSMPLSEVELGYINMQLDGIIDPSDFIDAHRPSFFIESTPEIEWQNTIGGSSGELLHSITETSDGGFILGGWSNSNISGDKSQNSIGLSDYWILKTDQIGNIQWQNTIGGDQDEYLSVIKQTNDGGYIIGGYSGSGISGNKTESTIDDTGGYDYWIVKTDEIGNVEWENTIGGSGYDLLFDLSPTSDGGFILGGYTDSPVSGDKTEPNAGTDPGPFGGWGSYDYWVVKIDSIGNIQWQNTIGGEQGDILFKIRQTSDNGFILAGLSQSNISGDKTENNYGTPDTWDFWIVKLDEVGNVIWDNTIGGNAQEGGVYMGNIDIIQSNDGGYILGGTSCSGISGDKIEPNIAGSCDFWLLKLDDVGNIIWQNTIGGNGDEKFNRIIQTEGGEYIISGSSDSNISGDKTEISHGNYDYWIIKLNTFGSIKWQKTIGGNLNDGGEFMDSYVDIYTTIDGGYILGGESLSNISGNKTENCIGLYDYWIVKLTGNCAITAVITPSGSTTFCNGLNVNLQANIGAGYSYQWFKNDAIIVGATNSNYIANKTGNYSVTITNGGCSATSSSIAVTVNPKPNAYVTNMDATNDLCFDASIKLKSNTGAGFTYQWYKGATSITGATSYLYYATTSGSYKVSVTNAYGCSKTSTGYGIVQTCREGIANKDEISVTPNPTSGLVNLNFEYPINPGEIFVSGIDGRILSKVAFEGNVQNIQIDLSAYPPGLYNISIVNVSEQSTYQVIKAD
jgi:hypothetical protein